MVQRCIGRPIKAVAEVWGQDCGASGPRFIGIIALAGSQDEGDKYDSPPTREATTAGIRQFLNVAGPILASSAICRKVYTSSAVFRFIPPVGAALPKSACRIHHRLSRGSCSATMNSRPMARNKLTGEQRRLPSGSASLRPTQPMTVPSSNATALYIPAKRSPACNRNPTCR